MKKKFTQNESEMSSFNIYIIFIRELVHGSVSDLFTFTALLKPCYSTLLYRRHRLESNNGLKIKCLLNICNLDMKIIQKLD